MRGFRDAKEVFPDARDFRGDSKGRNSLSGYKMRLVIHKKEPCRIDRALFLEHNSNSSTRARKEKIMKARIFYPVPIVPLLPPVWWYVYAVGLYTAYADRLAQYY